MKPSRGLPNEKMEGEPRILLFCSPVSTGFSVARCTCVVWSVGRMLPSRGQPPQHITTGLKSGVRLGGFRPRPQTGEGGEGQLLSQVRSPQMSWFTEYEGRANENCTNEESETLRGWLSEDSVLHSSMVNPYWAISRFPVIAFSTWMLVPFSHLLSW